VARFTLALGVALSVAKTAPDTLSLHVWRDFSLAANISHILKMRYECA
jgi:hypothetical protein